MGNSISKNVRVSQLTGLTLRSRERSRNWYVMAFTKGGDVKCVGSFVSSREPTEKRLLDLLRGWPEFVTSVSRVTVYRRDVYKYGIDFSVGVSNEV